MTERETGEQTDILILGAGLVGLTLALALRDTPWRVTLIDRRPFAAQHEDPRALALSHGARQLLQTLGAWPESPAATAIKGIHVSQRDGFGRALMQADEYRLPALGYVIRYKHLATRLQAAMRRLPQVECLDTTTLEALQMHADGGVATLTRQGETRRVHARLVVHAEGTPNDDPTVEVADYHQHAVICDVTPDCPHNNRAWERFTPDGPLALLPLEAGFSVVFTVPPARADVLMAMNEADFLAALSRQFGSRFGFTAAGRRDRFPLALRQRRQLFQGREVWIGNAAQTLHPVSGQGFNLGLRDAWVLAEVLADSADLAANLDTELACYAARRQLDRCGGALFTDKVVRLFSNNLPPLRWARGLGLAALDLFPPAKDFIARRMIFGARGW
ncbi:MAG: FAD-dependent oxidoreductase [Zoogloeaceae bacterium]|jgi:2-octaprenyl-6-methoxyphenol hydroxylase|nr:FAD-dependent oxidoreductase [Zoogloeaceae bacterium]